MLEFVDVVFAYRFVFYVSSLFTCALVVGVLLLFCCVLVLYFFCCGLWVVCLLLAVSSWLLFRKAYAAVCGFWCC